MSKEDECLHCDITDVVARWLTERKCDGTVAINELFRCASDIWAAGRPGARPSRSDLHTILDLHLDESEKQGKRLRSMN